MIVDSINKNVEPAPMIKRFVDEYYFLSNFYPVDVYFAGIKFKNSEAAFQAMKCIDPKDRNRFSNLLASGSKKLGRSINLRPDWEFVKEEIMYKVLLAKFSQHMDLMDKLLATFPSYLEEGNDWNDREWGVCQGRGQNKLGWILMRLRADMIEARRSQIDLYTAVYTGDEYV